MSGALIEAIAKAIKDARALPGTTPVARLSYVDRRAAQAALTAITEAGYSIVATHELVGGNAVLAAAGYSEVRAVAHKGCA